MIANRTFVYSKISDWPIKKKLTLLITFVALVCVLLGGIVVVVEDIYEHEDEFSEKMVLLSKMVGNYAAVDVEFGDSKAAIDSLIKLEDIPAIINAHLYDKNGKKFVSLKESELDKNLDLNVISPQLFNDNKFIVTMSIEFNGKQNGYIQLVTSTKEINHKIERRLIITSIFGVFLSILVYSLAYWLQGIISRPILSLTQTAKDLSENPDYSMRVSHNAKDEIGLLFDSFNKMLDTIDYEQKNTKDALQELKESEARFSAMFNSIPDAVMFADPDRKIRLNNPAVFDLFQYTDKDLLGNTTEILYPSHEAYVEQGKERYNKNSVGMDLPYEVQYKRKDGSVFWTESLGIKVLTSSGEHIGFLGVFRDITDRKLSEEKLLLQKEEQKHFLDTMIDAVISIDVLGNIISVNRGAETMFGYSVEEVLGKNVNMLMPSEYANHHDKFVKNYVETGQAKIIGSSREVSGLRKSGDTFPLRLSVAELPEQTHGVSRFIGTCQDITLEKQQEEILQRSQKMDAIGKLTGGVAHDFNNMIGVILGYSQLLENKLDKNNKEYKYNEEIYNAGERARELTSKLLSFSRKRPIATHNENINLILADIQLMLEKTLTARIKLTLVMDENLWLVNIDKSSLVDSILNMGINAMHVMPNGGSLEIETKNIHLSDVDSHLLNLVAGDYVKVSLSDTGMGMTEDIQERLFEPFFTTKGEHGTGLGLSQVYGFVTQSKGAIQVLSKLGEGTRFDLYFPRDLSAPVSVKKSEIEETDKANIAANILIVDDELSLLKLAEEILGNQGYQIYTSVSGKDALDILCKEPIDLIISDIIMPEMDGYRLAAEVKNKFPEVKIQLVSGYHDSVVHNEIDEELQKNILAKPYIASELINRTQDLVKDLKIKPNKNLNVLILDDEENVHKLMDLNLRKLGHKAFFAYTGEEAVKLYETASKSKAKIDLVIVDLNVIGNLDGVEVAREILAIDPIAKLIVSSGHSESEIMENYSEYGFKAAMEKSFTRKELNSVINKVILD